MPDHGDHSVDYYALLGIPADADAAEITRAYRHQLRRLHPDTRDHDPDPLERPMEGAVGAALALLQEAFAVLGDPDRRAAYDRRTHRSSTPPRRSPATTQTVRPYLTGPPAPSLRAGPVRYRPTPRPGGDR